MPSRRALSVRALLGLALLFASGNVWFAAARSTIPLELHGTVADTQRLIEKTPGVDDVYFVTLDSAQRIQVDRPVFDAVAQGQVIHKTSWTPSLAIDGHQLSLSWSRDMQGMIWAMPVTVAICVLLGVVAVKRPG